MYYITCINLLYLKDRYFNTSQYIDYMDAESKNNFIIYLQKNPRFFAIAKSELCISLLKYLQKKGLSVKDFKDSEFGYIKEEDLLTLLELLYNLKLLEKHKIIGKEIYYTNENTKNFLEIYDNTKKQYNL